MKNHLKLCKKNLKDKRVKCCLECPFEDEIVKFDPQMEQLFLEKRNTNLKKIKVI
jgi:hypothetical protein